MSGSSRNVTLHLNVIGDSTSGRKAVEQVAKASESASGRAKRAFSSVTGILTRSGVLAPFQEALDGLGETFDKLGQKGVSLGEKLAGIGAGAAGLGLLGTVAGSGDKQALAQLKVAVENTGASWEDYEHRLESAAKSQAKYGFTAKDSMRALQTLTQATHSPQEALKLLATASDLAAAKHMDLVSAAEQMGKAYNGSTRLLKQFGITAGTTAVIATKKLETATRAASTADAGLATAKKKLADLEVIDAGKKKLSAAESIHLRDAQDAVSAAAGKAFYAHIALAKAQTLAKNAAHSQDTTMGQLAAKLHGQAAAGVSGFTGKMKVLRAEVENHVAEWGQKYGPALTGVGAGLSVLGAGMSGASAILSKFRGATTAATAATEAMSGAEDAAAVSEGLALGPILLIIAAAAALGIGIYVLATHWKAIWGGIKHVVQDVWGWIKTNWPLLLAIITGPVGIAALMVVRHWNTIKSGAVSAFTTVRNFVQRVIADIIGFFAGLPGRAVSFVASIPGRILSLEGRFLGAGLSIGGQIVTGLENAFGAIVGFFANIGSEIVHAIVNGIESAGGAIGGAIKGIVGHLPGGGLVTGALHTIGIPGFAQGGIVPGAIGAPTLAIVHGGERVVPVGVGAAARASGGNTYVFNLAGMVGDKRALAQEIKNMLISLEHKGYAA